MSIARWITGRALLSPAKVAIIYADTEISYEQLDRRINALAAALTGLGVKATDRVAILEYNTPDYIALLFACAHLGATLVPLNWRLATGEHQWQLDNCDPTVLVCGEAFLEHAQGLMDNSEVQHWVAATGVHDGWQSLDQLTAGAVPAVDGVGTLASAAVLVYTSGTTGFPKGAVLTQSALFWSCVNSQQAHQLTAADIILTDLPLFHVGGMNIQTLPALHCGATVVLHNRFDPDQAFNSIEKFRPSVHLAVPPTLSALTDHPRWQNADLSSIRLLMTGSSVVPTNLIDTCFDRGVVAGQVYGSTETGPLVIALDAEHASAHRGSCGKPPIHCDARILSDSNGEMGVGESGEIVVRGPNLFSGYWKDEAATSQTMIRDWFRTGDIGHVDDDGYYYVDDRKKDVIISGGENIYPAEVEQALGQLVGVREYAVVGKTHERWGEVPVLVVVPEDIEVLNSATFTTGLEEKIAPYKVPREVITCDALPRNAMGKVLKYRIRQWLAESCD